MLDWLKKIFGGKTEAADQAEAQADEAMTSGGEQATEEESKGAEPQVNREADESLGAT